MSALATLFLLPQLLSVSTGQHFTLALVARAATTTGTIEAKISFDPALLTADSFALIEPWVEVVEPGYHVLDTRGGRIIETAGYPGGFIGTTTLGTITFEGKRAGRALVVVTGASVMLDAGNTNVFGGSAGGAVVSISGPAAAAGAPPGRVALPILAASAALAPHDWLASLASFLRRLHFYGFFYIVRSTPPGHF